MSENPYEAPPPIYDAQVVGVKSGRVEDVKAVAVYQKGIIACIGIYLLLVIFQFALPQEARILLVFLILPLMIAAPIFTILLAIKVYDVIVGVLLGVLALVPCVGLLALLVINGKATSILQQNGYRVGFFGADLSQFRR
jgi:hypothetical protein